MNSFVEELERLIRAGSLIEARGRLREVRVEEIPRSSRVAVAAAARKANLPALGQRILEPLLAGARADVADPELRIEYAACLLGIGAVTEAARLLAAIDANRHARAALFSALERSQAWDHEAALAKLESYRASVSGHELRVAEATRLAALVALERFAEAEALGEELERECAREGELRLALNAGLSLARAAFAQGDWDRAQAWLDRAAGAGTAAARSSNLADESFSLRKWARLLALARDPESLAARAGLLELRQQAYRSREWEACRDCDLQLSLLTRDLLFLARVFHGSPFPGFRARVQALAARRGLGIPGHYLHRLGPVESAGEPPTLDLREGRIDGEQAIRRGGLVHRALVAVFADLYRPSQVPQLHALLFPGEFYNSDSSPQQVYQALSRARSVLARARFPVRISGKTGWIGVIGEGAALVRLSETAAPGAPRSRFDYEIIRERFGAAEFSSSEAASALALPLRTAQSRIRELVGEGRIAPSPTRPRSRYVVRQD